MATHQAIVQQAAGALDLSVLPTPALLIDASVVHRNLERMADYCRTHAIRLRPHCKTHKSKLIGALQASAGAVGHTAARVGEIGALTSPGDDVLLAFPPVDAPRARDLASFALDRTVRAAVDSAAAVEAAAASARGVDSVIGLLVDLNVGLGRTGVCSPADSLALAQAIDATRGVRLDGIMIYPGHIWERPELQGPALRSVASIVGETKDLWARHGLEAKIVSGGSTPTAYQSHTIEAITEIRPGTYVFNDMNTVRGGFCDLVDCAATILCTVVSDAVYGQCVIDAGTKALAGDRCIPAPDSGHGHVVEYPHAKIVRLSEEHGQIDVTGCDVQPSIGERLTVIPNHICPCVNLRDHFWWIEPECEPRQVSVTARGVTS